MSYNYVSRPDPDNFLSGKRQRVGTRDRDSVDVKLLGPLPEKVESIPGLSQIRQGFSGIAISNDKTKKQERSYGWVVTAECRHVYIWRLLANADKSIKTKGEFKVTRLHLSKSPNIGESGPTTSRTNTLNMKWHLFMFDPSDAGISIRNGNSHNFGIVLASSCGDVFCWPIASAETTPSYINVLSNAAEENDNISVSVVRKLPLNLKSLSVIMGLSDGRLLIATLSLHDYTLSYDTLADFKGSNSASQILSNGAALVGKWLGFSSQSGIAVAESQVSEVKDDDNTSCAIRDLVIVPSDTETVLADQHVFFIFALYGNGMLRSWNLIWSNSRRDLKFCWEFKRLRAECEQNLGSVHAILFDRVLWVGHGGVGTSHSSKDRLLVAVRSQNSENTLETLCLYEIKGVSDDTPVPRIGNTSENLTFENPDGVSDHIIYTKLDKSWDPSKTPGPSATILICRKKLKIREPLKLVGIDFPKADAKWSKEAVIDGRGSFGSDCSTWFAFDTCQNEALIITSTSYFRTWLETTPDLEISGEEAPQISTLAKLPSRSSTSIRKYTQSDAEKIMGRVFRNFYQAITQGRDGYAEVAHDDEWSHFQHYVDPEALGSAVLYVSKLELDKEASQRWAEKWAAQENYFEFAPKLVHRHLIAKKSRVLGKDGIISLLKRVGLIDRIPMEVRVQLRGYAERLEACVELCRLQSSFNSEIPEEHVFMHNVLKVAMKQVLILRQNCDSEEQLNQQLKVAGLSVSDLFYSQVTSLEQILPVVGRLDDEAVQNNKDNSFMLLSARNIVLETVFRAALRIKNDPDLNLALMIPVSSDFARSWTEDEELLNILALQIGSISALLDRNQLTETVMDARSFDVGNTYANRFVRQQASLGEILLEGMQKHADSGGPLDREKYEKAKEFVLLPLVSLAEQFFIINEPEGAKRIDSHLAEEAVVLTHALAEKYVHFESLIRICEIQRAVNGFEEGQKLLQKYVHAYSNSLIRVQTIEPPNDAEVDMPSGGHTVILRIADLFLSVSAKANDSKKQPQLHAIECHGKITASEIFVLARNDSLQNESDNAMWSLKSCDKGSLWVHYGVDEEAGSRISQRWGVKKRMSLPKDLSFMFTLAPLSAKGSTELVEDVSYYQLASASSESVLGIDSSGTLVDIHRISEWKGMARFCFDWYIKKANHNPYVLVRLAESIRIGGYVDEFLDLEFEDFLSRHRHEPATESHSSSGQVTHLEWIHRLHSGSSLKAARVLLDCARTEQESLAQRKTLLSIGKLAVWSENETVSEQVETQLDYVYDAQNILRAFGGKQEQDKVSTVQALVDLLLEGNSNTSSNYSEDDACSMYAYCLGMLNRAEDRIQIENNGGDMNTLTDRLNDLAVLRMRVWWDIVLQDENTWTSAVNAYIENNNSNLVEEKLSKTKFVKTAAIVMNDVEDVANPVLSRYGLDQASVQAMAHKVVGSLGEDQKENVAAWENVFYKALTSTRV